MAGCTCPTCTGARAYNQNPARKAAQAARQRARKEAWTEADWAYWTGRHRAWRRAQSDARDAARLAEIKERNSQS